MRLLQLALDRDELLDLHPNMTVVQGLDEAAHRVLVETVRGLTRDEAHLGGGLVEAHGVLFELRRDLLEVLELSAADIDPVVRPGDLPTQPLTVDARELKASEQEFSELLEQVTAQAERLSRARDVVAAADSAVRDAHHALDDCRAAGQRRRQQVEELAQRLAEMAERRGQIEQERADLGPSSAAADRALAEVEARTETIRTRALDASALHSELEAERDGLAVDLPDDDAEGLDRARRALDEVTTAVEAERAAATDSASRPRLFEARSPEAEPPAVLLEQLGARLGEIDRRLAAMASGDTDDVVEALDAMRAGGAGDLIPSVEAAALADDLRSLAFEIGADDAELVVDGSLAEARERLDDSRQALLEAEQAARNPELDRAEVNRLEEAHEALLEAKEKADGRLAGGRARSRVGRLRELEQEVLDRLGFTSYSAYMMGTSLQPTDPAKEVALDAARAALAKAEDEWHRLQQDTEAALTRAALLDRRRALVAAAARFIDPVPPIDDLAAELRLVRVRAVSAEQAAELLREALQRQGLDLGDEELDVEDVAMFAEAWLAEASAADERVRALVQERAALLAEEPGLRAAVEAGSTEGYTLSTLAASAPAEETGDPAETERRARLDAASAALSEAEDRWLSREVALEQLAALEPRLAAAAEGAMTAGAAAAGAEQEVALARAEASALRSAIAQLDEELTRMGLDEGEVRAALDAADGEGSEPAQLEAALREAEAQQRDAEMLLDTETRLLATLDSSGLALAMEIERLQDIVASQAGGGGASPAEELEWYLLARLAAQRSVSVAGAVPLLLDDALRGLDEAGVHHLLGRLEPMTEAVQIILVSEDPVVATWAREAGSARAAVVRPTAA